MTDRSLADIAIAVRDRRIRLDGLGDFGSAQAEDVRLLAHDIEDAIQKLREFESGIAGLCVHWNDTLERLDRLERMYLPRTGAPQ